MGSHGANLAIDLGSPGLQCMRSKGISITTQQSFVCTKSDGNGLGGGEDKTTLPNVISVGTNRTLTPHHTTLTTPHQTVPWQRLAEHTTGRNRVRNTANCGYRRRITTCWLCILQEHPLGKTRKASKNALHSLKSSSSPTPRQSGASRCLVFSCYCCKV